MIIPSAWSGRSLTSCARPRGLIGHPNLNAFSDVALRRESPLLAPEADVFARFPVSLLIDFGLDETGKVTQRILPAEIARFHGMASGTPSCTMLRSVRRRLA